jgi:hypothetical protein
MRLIFIAFFLFVLLPGVSFAQCEYDFASVETSMTDLTDSMSTHFPFSVVLYAKDMISGLTEIEATPIYAFNYEVWGTTYYPLSMFESSAMDTFFAVLRWLFLLLVFVRISFVVIQHFFKRVIFIMRKKLLPLVFLVLTACDPVEDVYNFIGTFFEDYFPDLVCWISRLFVSVFQAVIVFFISLASGLVSYLPEYTMPTATLGDSTFLQYTAYFFPVAETATLIVYLFTFATGFLFLRVLLRWLKIWR